MPSAEYMREYFKNNRETILARKREWNRKNKEKIATWQKKYYQEHKEEIATKNKEFNQTPKGKRLHTIDQWKYKGLIHDDYDRLYDAYLESTNCEECDVEYGVKGDGTMTFKCMDHDHQNGYFRNFLCSLCNIRRG